MRNRVLSKTLQNARSLRGAPTAFEKLLWRELQKLNRQGHHFRRQVPFRGYILDFLEHGARLVVELDGAQHTDPQQAKHDLKRDTILEREGYLVMRFNNGEIQWIGSVVDAIERELLKRKRNPSHPERCAFRPRNKCGASSPHKGEVYLGTIPSD
ncbi:MAG: endonuclease domain-containing protein [Alphaproteobacteria bacterium]|nr:endonuclease domain-containing protein [Alphaproteobacteria bacterium]